MREILKNYTILYAEDDEVLQLNTNEYLERYFKKVYLVADGKEALEKYNNVNTDVLLLDIHMPFKDGISVAQEIRKGNKNVPILMLTAYTDVDKLLRVTELNLCKYLVKPVNTASLKEAFLKLCTLLQEQNNLRITLKENYYWDAQRSYLFKSNIIVELTAKERILLSLLILHAGKCVSFEEIMAVVWEDDFEIEITIDAIKYHITQLRKKLPKNCIQSIYAKGFMFF
jgi:DNA-binding response OmpR family regulator